MKLPKIYQTSWERQRAVKGLPGDVLDLVAMVEADEVLAHEDYVAMLLRVGEAKADAVLAKARVLGAWIKIKREYVGKKSDLRPIRAMVLEQLGIGTTVHLNRMMKKFEAKGVDSLVHSGYGNRNRAVTDSDSVVRVRQLLQRHTPISEIAEDLGVSYGTAWNLVNSAENVQANVMAKWGVKEWRRRFDMIIKRKRPTKPNQLWVIDGTVVELLCEVKGKPSRIYWVYVIDAFDWDCVGYAFSLTEKSDVVQEAVYNAYLMRKCLPHQIQTDNGSAFKSKQTKAWAKLACKKFTPHAVGNARAKIAESWWNTFNGSFLRKELNWTGKNITAKTGPLLQEALTNKLKKAIKIGLPQMAGVVQQVERHLDDYREKVVSKVKVEANGGWFPRIELIAKLFWEYRRVKGKVQTYYYDNNGICFKHKGIDYQFVVLDETGSYDTDFHLFGMGKRYRVKCDVEHLDLGVLLYDGDKPVIMAKLMDKMAMAMADHSAESRTELAQYQGRKKELYHTVKELATVKDEVWEAEQMTNYKMALGHLGKGDLNTGEDFVKGRGLRDEVFEGRGLRDEVFEGRGLRDEVFEVKRIDAVEDVLDDFDFEVLPVD